MLCIWLVTSRADCDSSPFTMINVREVGQPRFRGPSVAQHHVHGLDYPEDVDRCMLCPYSIARDIFQRRVSAYAGAASFATFHGVVIPCTVRQLVVVIIFAQFLSWCCG